jgi:proton-translocating NADH-quinone oxidoreductase chain N
MGVAGIILLGDAFAGRELPRPALMGIALAGLALSAWAALPLVGLRTSTFNGALAVDAFAVYFKFLLLLATALVILASGGLMDSLARYKAEFVALLLLSTAALMVLSAANDLITVYIALEMSSLSIAFLSAWNKRDLRSTEAGLKFFLLSAMSSAILLYGMALLYGVSGSLRLDAIGRGIGSAAGGPVFLALAMLLAGLGFKVSAVPFQMWTPDVYEGAPTPVTAYLSVASKAAGFAVAIRIFTTALFGVEAHWAPLIALLALATMTVGNVAALVQTNVKRLLAYSSIAHAGYILVGIAAASERGVSAVLFYLLAYAATNLTAFIAVIAITERLGSERIADFRGLHQRAPGLALALAIGLLSLAGLPPFAGFFGKLYVFWAAAESGLLWLVLAAVVNSALSLFYYAQIIHEMYMVEPAEAVSSSEFRVPSAAFVGSQPLGVALATAVAGVVLLGILSGLFFGIQDTAALTVIRSAKGPRSKVQGPRSQAQRLLGLSTLDFGRSEVDSRRSGRGGGGPAPPGPRTPRPGAARGPSSARIRRGGDRERSCRRRGRPAAPAPAGARGGRAPPDALAPPPGRRPAPPPRPRWRGAQADRGTPPAAWRRGAPAPRILPPG